MTSSRTAIGAVAAAIVLLAAPGGASAEYLVPPSNSAATQYTETIPTGGGKRDAERSDSIKARDPDKVLGSGNAKRLEAEGQAGRETAELAAATAPSLAAAGSGPGGGNGPTGGGDSPGNGAEPRSTNGQPSGSSAIGEVANQAIGSPSSGQMGMFLPLLIVAALLWSLWYLLRQRQDRTT